MLYRVMLYLARNSEFPSGSGRHGYEIIAPLDEKGQLDAEAWHEDRERCGVRRFWADEDDRLGWLVHRAGGVHGATWLIDYDQTRTDDDEIGYRLDSHVFEAGEYLTLRDHTGPHTFRIATVEPWRGSPVRIKSAAVRDRTMRPRRSSVKG